MAAPIDDLYWRAYSAAILTLVSARAPLGPDIKVFVAPPLQRGIAGGSFIPEAVTNNLLYHIADDLLPADSPIYIPGGSAKYSGQLAKYLNWVKVSNNLKPEELSHLNETLKTLDSTQLALDSRAKLAITQYSKLPDTEKIPFEDWCTKNAQYLISARDANLTASGKYDQALVDYYGPDAGLLIQCKDNIKLGKNILSLNTGYNMSCTLADLSNTEALWKASDGGKKPVPVDSSKLFYLPAFSLQGYRDTVDFWVSHFGKNPSRIHINMNDGKKVAWKDLGFSKVNHSRNSPYWYVFSTTAAQSHAPANSNGPANFNGPANSNAPAFKYLDLGGGVKNAPVRQVSLELVVNGLQNFPVNPGAWDTPGVKELFPNLREAADASLSTSLIRVESLILAYGVGITAVFGESARDEVHTMLTETMKAGGSARVFGFDIVPSPSASTNGGRSVTFDQVDWNKENGSLVIPPADDGFPTLLGVFGRHLTA